MARRMFVWLTDEEAEAYERQCEERGIEYSQLATLAVCQVLGLEEVPTKKKKLKKWLDAHKARTQAEFGRGQGGTASRVATLMGGSDREVWTTTQIRDALGWKQSGSLNDLLRVDARFKAVSRPEDMPRQRGAQPNYWRLRR